MTSSFSSNPITPEGRRRLEAEIARLKRTERPLLLDAVRETSRAHGMGDISSAKQQLVDFDIRLQRLETRLAATFPVDPRFPPDRSRVHFGAEVTCIDDSGQERLLVLVGPEEADPAQNRVSWNAPIARALAGSGVGDEIRVRTPGGENLLEITSIAYPPASPDPRSR